MRNLAAVVRSRGKHVRAARAHAFVLTVAAAGLLVGFARPVLAQFGEVSFANSGAPAAQAAFLRGLALLHSFQYPQAAAAFQQAQKADPKFAMAYWGEAMTYNHGVWREQDSVAARPTLARLGATPAERLAKAPTEREKDYLRTLDVLYSTAGTKVGRDSAYANAVAQLSLRYPDDVDAQLFHALSLLSLFPRTDSTYLRAASIAAKVMREHPQHPGALHYVIHAYDDPAHAKLGLDAARRYSKVAPTAAHAQHMTSHIFIALGMWDDVVAANEVAIRTVETARGAVTGPPCGHPALWLHYAYLQQGRIADARRMMDACRATSADSPAATRGYAEMRAQYVVDADPPARDVPNDPSDVKRPAPMQFTLDLATAYDALRRGDTTNVAALIGRMQAAQTTSSTSAMAKMMPEMVGAMTVSLDEIRALVLLRRGNKDDAVALLRRAAAEEDAIPFVFGPPEVEKPSHELLGETLLAMGRVAEARREFQLALARTPGRSLTLLDLARASHAIGDSAAASAAYKQLVSNWHRADAVTDAVREARRAAPRGRDSKP
jgi:tetratricopeptide (TPR) repeat protein